jgi:hypothetical protein
MPQRQMKNNDRCYNINWTGNERVADNWRVKGEFVG